MNSQEVIKYIIDNDLTLDILEKLGCHSINANGRDIRAALPNDDDNTKISINPETLNIRVFTKSESIYGSIFNLIMFIHNCEFFTAFQWCCNSIGISDTKFIKKDSPISLFKKIKKHQENKEQQYYNLSILNQYSRTPHIDLIHKDGLISQQILDKYLIRFDPRTDRILFPHLKYDDCTKIAGITGRTVNKAWEELKMPKYLSMLDTDYKKNYNLYGLSLNEKNIKKQGIVIVFEAEKSVMKADMFGYPIGVAVGCHEISSFQKKLLIGLDVEICIAFDTDVEQEHILNICNSLNYFRKVSYIQDKWNLLKYKDSPVDRGHKKWNYLFNHRTFL